MKNDNALYTIIGCSLIAFFCYCPGNNTTGGAVEDGNAVSVTGVVVEDNGATSSAIVSLVPSDFNSATKQLPDSLIDTTGSDGMFYFSLIPVGEYNVFFVPIQ